MWSAIVLRAVSLSPHEGSISVPGCLCQSPRCSSGTSHFALHVGLLSLPEAARCCFRYSSQVCDHHVKISPCRSSPCSKYVPSRIALASGAIVSTTYKSGSLRPSVLMAKPTSDSPVSVSYTLAWRTILSTTRCAIVSRGRLARATLIL